MTTIPNWRRVQSRAATRMAALFTSGALAACSANLISGPVGDANAPLAAADPATPIAGEKPSPARPPQIADASQQPQTLAEFARAHTADPRNPLLALSYARALKKTGKRKEALAMLDTAVETSPSEHALQVEQGLLALELGQTEKAAQVLKVAAASPARDWRVLSGLGVAESSLGRQKEAQRQFTRALELAPNNPAVLNNMAMSLLLERKVDQAEAMLRRASKGGSSSQQVTQNLALTKVLRSEGLAGVE